MTVEKEITFLAFLTVLSKGTWFCRVSFTRLYRLDATIGMVTMIEMNARQELVREWFLSLC
jgi:hypothetical protein